MIRASLKIINLKIILNFSYKEKFIFYLLRNFFKNLFILMFVGVILKENCIDLKMCLFKN